jgi:AraC family transcriptional regulator, transcriptional activator of pobA
MDNHNSYTLIDQQNGNLAFKVLPFENNVFFDHLQRLNYFSLILILEGKGFIRSDSNEFELRKDQLLCFTPYQPFLIQSDSDLRGVAIHFHSDFFCIIKHQKEVSCNGVLFNSIYKSPTVSLEESERIQLLSIIDDIKKELDQSSLAQNELIVSYLKIFLIQATRIKLKQNTEENSLQQNSVEPILLQNLKDAIERNFKEKHSAGDYADILNINSRNLAALVKKYFGKTLTDLIFERITIEAKRELYLTSKSIREIAFELGFSDEFYFSRFFKNITGISPSLYRETVGFARGEA